MNWLAEYLFSELNSRSLSQTSDIWHTLLGNKFVDHSDVVGAAPILSSFFI